MDKPMNHGYKPDTISFRLIEGDWSDKTKEQIASIIGATPKSVKNAIYRIWDKTGYDVPHIRKHSKKDHRTLDEIVSLPPQSRSGNPYTPNKCDTCQNVDCRFLLARQAVCWVNCGGYIRE